MKEKVTLTQAEARDFLRWYLLHLAEEKFAPFLCLDREIRLWKAAHEPGEPVDPLTEDSLSPTEAAMLRFLADRAGGWFVGMGGISGQPRFVPIADWRLYVACDRTPAPDLSTFSTS